MGYEDPGALKDGVGDCERGGDEAAGGGGDDAVEMEAGDAA